ncbi:protein VACUOLELESS GAMETOPHYTES isoform X1 [Spinacia oleracea]|uniref:Protein VACUOLELESS GAMETOPHYTES isoform X1 n=1 Tax=Spinacia oleracea TaxID=3562 RepID=A0A9R0JJ80_SPIOL|nr:protein VACUOLELESS GAMETOPHYTES-like isoform X1 [Spinacia oleracea]
MMCKRSSYSLGNSSTTGASGLILKRSAAAPKPTMEVAAAPPPLPFTLLPHSQLTNFVQRSHSRGNHEYDQHHDLQVQLQKKAIIEFPVSPEADADFQITSSNHPHHRMVQVNLPNPFTCMGCKEYGAGSRFTCQQCNFELHDFCALAPPVLKAHPLHSQHQLIFTSRPAGKAGLLRSKCDVCGKSAKGYMFHCSACSFQLHPCCAMLSAKMKFPTHPHSLVILPATANSGEMLCSECKKRRTGKVYQCTVSVCDYCLHAVCAKSMVNGLHANGIKGLENDKPNKNMLGAAAKIASHVVVGLMGGLIEGIGEGLGEALSQNLLKGRCNSTRRIPGNTGN